MSQYSWPGLSSDEVQLRSGKYGKNEIAKESSYSIIRLFLSQFTSPLIYVLLIAAVVTYVLHDIADAAVIFLAVIVNTMLGFFQEFKAEKSLETLSSYIHPQVTVIRDGVATQISSEELVPGDMMLLESGDKISADGIVVNASNASVNESVVTGEVVAVSKHAVPKELYEGDELAVRFSSLDQAFVAVEDRSGEEVHSVYAGTSVIAGTMSVVVVRTGVNSTLGIIAETLSNTEQTLTPLQKRLSELSKFLALMVGVIAIGLFCIGILYGKGFLEMFTLAVAVAVSAIPEGLVVSLTAILAIGMQRILKRKALVRKLTAAEVLGSVTVICSDKTGTITKGVMEISELITEDTDLMMAGLLSSADLKDPMEVQMHEYAVDKLTATEEEHIMRTYERLDRLPFSSERRYSATLTTKELFVIGAPELVLERCRMNDKEREKLTSTVVARSKKGLRVVAVAHRKRKKEDIIDDKALEKSWYFLGFIVYSDEVRPDIKQVFAQAKRAGMDIKVITGDYAETAKTIMHQAGIGVSDDEVMMGNELAKLSSRELDKQIHRIHLFARTTPTQKLAIVESLQRNGEVVAMSGDGVNDAPALKRADIGVVVSSASDVSKETADMVLLDDNFGTVIAAVEEGRGIFENLRKVMVYLLSDSFSEVVIVVLAIILNWELPITAAMILWVNLANDGFPNLALTFEPKDTGLLRRPPRRPESPLIDKDLLWLMGMMSVASAIAILSLFGWARNVGYELMYAQTLAFMLLGVDSLVCVFSVRSMTEPVWKINQLQNPWLLLGVFGGFILMLLAVYVPYLQKFLGTVSVDPMHWLIVLGISLVEVSLVELMKYFVFERKLR